MRHRTNPDDDGKHEGRYPPPAGASDRSHHQCSTNNQQLQKEVIQLKRLMRVQNRLIIALSSCFVLVILSTLVLIQHLPHPNDEGGPFWEQNQQHLHSHQLQRKQGPIISRQTSLQQDVVADCSSYGCSIRPMEMTQISNNTVQSPFIASSNHIMLTHKSNRKKPAPINQDRGIIIPSFGIDNYINSNDDITKRTTIHPTDNFFIGLFDGHDDRGHEIAQFASEQVPSRIATKLHSAADTPNSNGRISDERVKEIIASTFVEVDRDVPVTGGGCTAHIMIRRGGTLFLANTGDSTAYIGVYTPPKQYDDEQAQLNEQYISTPRNPNVQLHLQGSVTIHNENTKHKPHFLKELARIESLGGKVHTPKNNPMGSRVIARSSLHGEDVGLAMSRSIGDWEWTSIGVIPDPDVTVLDLNTFWTENGVEESGAKVFVVLGSDGLFDARRVEFVSNHIAYGLFEYHMNPKDVNEEVFSRHLLDVGKKLVNMASPIKEEWYRDDITYIAKVIDL